MASSHWIEWIKDERRDYVMLGAYLGHAEARSLVPEVPEAGKTLTEFMKRLKALPWVSRKKESCYHFALLRAAVALGRAVLPTARKMNESESGAEALFTTEAWIVLPHALVRGALDRVMFYSAPPTAPREFQFQYQVADVVFSTDAIDRVVKSAEKILGKPAALESIKRELCAHIIEQNDPVRASIGERIFFGITTEPIAEEEPGEEALRVGAFPAGWEKPQIEAGKQIPPKRKLKATGDKAVDVIANDKGLFLISKRLRALFEKKDLPFEYVDCEVGSTPISWVRPRQTFPAFVERELLVDEMRFLQIDAGKVEAAPQVFFGSEAPRFLCVDTAFLKEWHAAGLQGLRGVVLPFGAARRASRPRNRRRNRGRTRGRSGGG